MAKTGRKLFDSLAESFSSTHISKQGREYFARSRKSELLFETGFVNVEEVHARKPGVIPKMWTPEEDTILRRAVEKHGEKNWRDIAEEVPDRNHLQCLQRWKKALKPGLVKGHWSKEEDNFLLKLMKDYPEGKWNWAKISVHIPGRNAKQCRERWFLNLDPSINRGPWTKEEDEKLMKYHREYNGRWSLIAKELKGRTENSVKTRFHSLQRKEVRSRGWIPDEDAVFIRGLRVYGRNYVLCARLLPGRSRGQLKKRFPHLCQVNPGLQQEVEHVENRITQGEKPTPIHIMLKALQEEKRRKKLQENKAKEFAAPPPTHKMKKFESSWINEIVDGLAEVPDDAPLNEQTLSRTNSATMFADLINGEMDTSHGNYESDGESLKSFDAFLGEPKKKALSSKKSSGLMVLNKLLNNMDDFGDVLSGDHLNYGAPTAPAPMDSTYKQVGRGGEMENVEHDGKLRRRGSSAWSKVLEDGFMNGGEVYQNYEEAPFERTPSKMQFEKGLPFERTLSGSSWGAVGNIHQPLSFDMPVV